MRWTGALHRFVGDSKSQLTFLGAADEVTGSYYLAEMPHLKFLVDCGMFQGDRKLIEKIAMHSVNPEAADATRPGKILREAVVSVLETRN